MTERPTANDPKPERKARRRIPPWLDFFLGLTPLPPRSKGVGFAVIALALLVAASVVLYHGLNWSQPWDRKDNQSQMLRDQIYNATILLTTYLAATGIGLWGRWWLARWLVYAGLVTFVALMYSALNRSLPIFDPSYARGLPVSLGLSQHHLEVAQARAESIGMFLGTAIPLGMATAAYFTRRRLWFH